MKLYLLLFLFIFNAYALTPKQIYQKYAKAVVRIDILYQGVPLSFGSGFFISGEGHLISNAHVIEDAFRPGYNAVITTKDGKKYTNKDLKVAGCRDSRYIDLCLMKVNGKTPNWIPVDRSPIVPGEKISVIGHPRGNDWTITEGIVSALRKHNSSFIKTNDPKTAINEIQVSAPISPGNSGGPIISENGKMIGISTWLRTDAQNINFGITRGEIRNYTKENKEYLPVPKFIKKNQEIMKKRAKMLKQLITAPILKSILKTGSVPNNGTSQTLKLPILKNQTLHFPIPANYKIENCKNKETKTQFSIACEEKGGASALIWRFHKKIINSKNLDGKTPKPVSLDHLDQLKKSGRWDAYKSKLKPNQIKRFYSIPKPFRCRQVKSGPNDALMKGSNICETFHSNFIDPNATSLFYFIENNRFGVSAELQIIFKNTFLAEYYRSVLQVVTFGAKIK